MIDIIFKICCIVILSILTFVIVSLIISVFRNAYELDTKLKKKDINRIKKQAYVEFADKLKNGSSIEWDYYDGAEVIDVEEIDRTLIELIRSII